MKVIKLVRDKIPKIMKKQNKEFEIKIINDDEKYLKLLKDKLIEESNKVIDSKNDENLIEELADVLEVLDCIIELKKIDKNKILEIKNKKEEEKGSFRKRILYSFDKK